VLGRWLRERRLRRLRDRARTLDPPALADDLDDLREAAADGGEQTRALAVEALAALARSGGGDARRADDVDDDTTDGPARDGRSVPERAADALAAALPVADDAAESTVVRTLRYVATERSGGVVDGDRLDDPCAAAVDDWNHAAHRRVCVDCGVFLRAGLAMPATRKALWTALSAGSPPVRRNAALAYLQVADASAVVDDPAAVATELQAVVAGRNEPLPATGTAARALAGGRTVSEAADRFGSASRSPAARARGRQRD